MSSHGVIGIIGGSGLLHCDALAKFLKEKIVPTEYGQVVVRVGKWKETSTTIVFCQRHKAAPDNQYKQPRNINFKAIIKAFKQLECEIVIGVYSVGSLRTNIDIGKVLVLSDYFNPISVLCYSEEYDAHVVPSLDSSLRKKLIQILSEKDFDPLAEGVYVQSAGPRFETKAEVRFFAQFGDVIGMTGTHEADLLSELKVPFAMLAIVDNHGNGLFPEKELTFANFKQAQQQNQETISSAVIQIVEALSI